MSATTLPIRKGYSAKLWVASAALIVAVALALALAFAFGGSTGGTTGVGRSPGYGRSHPHHQAVKMEPAGYGLRHPVQVGSAICGQCG